MRTEHDRVCHLAAEYYWTRALLQRVLFGAALTGPVARRAESVRWWLTVGVS